MINPKAPCPNCKHDLRVPVRSKLGVTWTCSDQCVKCKE